MEQILSAVFPCCFPRRRSGDRSQAPDSEQTPLLRDRHGSSSSSSSAGAILKSAATAALGADAGKSKHVSILPAPRYNAAALRSIVDDLKSKVIPLDSAAAEARLPQPLADQADTSVISPTDLADAKPVTPVHSLKLNISATTPSHSSSTSPISAKLKLVDIWSPPASAPVSGSTTPSQPLSYSAAAKKAKSAKSSAKRKQSPHNKNAVSTPSSTLPSVEQKTFETLSEVALSRPLVHAWDIEDEHH